MPTEFIEVQPNDLKLTQLHQTPPQELSDALTNFLEKFGGKNYSLLNVGICIDISKFFAESVPKDLLLVEKTNHAKRE